MTSTIHTQRGQGMAAEPKPSTEKTASPSGGEPRRPRASGAPAAPAQTQPTHTIATAPPMSQGRLAAILRGETVATETHPAVAKEEAVLEVVDFNLWYGQKQALFNINMRIPKGKVTALIGPSGCGKSTLLRSVNRLNDLNSAVRIAGDIRLNGDSTYAPDVDVIELRKRMGMVFQKSNPFPMSIYENVVYSLRIDGERNRQVLDDVCEHSLRGAALWDEAKDRLHESALSPVRRPAAAVVHRPGDRRRARGAADGRALLGPGSDRHRQDRGSDSGAAGHVFGADRHAQHAASLADQRLHGLHVLGARAGVRPDE